MNRNRAVIAIMAVVVLAVPLAGYALLLDNSEEQVPSGSVTVTTDSNFNLGITYLTITPGVAAHYDLGADSGALVTAVNRGGLADLVGIQAGDIIVSFNGPLLGQEAPLLGMMRGCHAGHTVVLEIWAENANRAVEFAHAVD